MWIWKWYLTFFCYSFSMEAVLRIWDFLIATDIFSLISFGLAVIKMNEKDFFEKDLKGLTTILNSFREKNSIDP